MNSRELKNVNSLRRIMCVVEGKRRDLLSGRRVAEIMRMMPELIQSVLHSLAGVETCFLKLSEEPE